MALMKIFIVALGFITTTWSCQLSSVCDTECSQLEANITAQISIMDTKYRLLYHVAPPVGWMNDPNGFVYYKGNYHIFYQYYPYASQWGPMHWGHSTSPNLVDWKAQQTALIPGNEQCFSGSAVVSDTTLVLMYTGHIVGVGNASNDESQYLALSDDGIHFHKYASNPVLRYSVNVTADFRDPKVWKYGDYWYVVVGTKTANGTGGRVLLYRSPDLVTWTYLSVLGESSGVTQSAYMWECPDFFELNGKYVLMMSPQGMNATGDRYKNLYQTGYIIGNFSYETYQFVPEVDFQELDYGHDFYATQSLEKDGKRILIAWFGMWESQFPEAADGWAGALTLFRELQLNGTRILMNPVTNITSLRQTNVTVSLAQNGEMSSLNQTGELIVTGNWSNPVQLQLKGRTGGGNVTLNWNPVNRTVSVDRAGVIRQVEWAPAESHSWRIFLDTSSVELFCGDGDVVFSSRVYPLGGWVVTNLSSQSLNVEAYTLRSMVTA